MPAFVMPLGDQQTWQCLDAFTQGYWEAAFFCECHSDNPELEGAPFADVAKESWTRALADCLKFQAVNAPLLAQAYAEHDYSPEQAGRDYWFTRNGHGCGFWDRDLGTIGDALSDACRYQSVDLYRGDDGRVYLS